MQKKKLTLLVLLVVAIELTTLVLVAVGRGLVTV